MLVKAAQTIVELSEVANTGMSRDIPGGTGTEKEGREEIDLWDTPNFPLNILLGKFIFLNSVLFHLNAKNCKEEEIKEQGQWAHYPVVPLLALPEIQV